MQRNLFILLGILLLSATAACGFRLQAPLSLPAEMDVTYLDYSATDIQVRQLLARRLVRNGVTLVGSAEQATAVLHITLAYASRKVLSKDRNGRPQEYQLTVTIAGRVLDADGFELRPAISVEANNVVVLNSADPIGSNAAADAMSERLREDAVRQFLLQLAAPEPVDSGIAPEAGDTEEF